MELMVLDQNLNGTGLIDVFESLIWTDRYCGYGDFEIYSSMDVSLFATFRQDYYIWMKESEHVMIIEGFRILSNAENGDKLVVTGRSLESILDRRIILRQTILSGNLQDAIHRLLDENAIVCTDEPLRVISRLVFEESTDPAITDLTVDCQFTGKNLYESIKLLCDANDLGFKITINDAGQFVFKLYSGVNRSYSQLSNPYVTFSPQFDNILNTNYEETKKSLKTVAIVAGEGEGSDRKTTYAYASESGLEADLARREMFTDARDISSTTNDGVLTDEEYFSQLEQRGYEDLVQNTFVQSFDGAVEPNLMYVYGTDYNMGDLVQIANEYGQEASSRVVEFILSQSTSGVSAYPTFRSQN